MKAAGAFVGLPREPRERDSMLSDKISDRKMKGGSALVKQVRNVPNVANHRCCQND